MVAAGGCARTWPRSSSAEVKRVPKLRKPGQVRLGRVEYEDGGIALTGSQAFRPARLGDGKHFSGRRV